MKKTMRIKGTFVNEIIDNDTFMVSMDNNVLQGFIRANKTATFIINCLQEETTEEKIVMQMIEKYKINKSQAHTCVCTIIDELRINGLLDE